MRHARLPPSELQVVFDPTAPRKFEGRVPYDAHVFQ